jgi:hypothetical protein
MKQLYLSLFSLIILGFISCDGRDRLDKTPQEVLQENQLLDSFSEKEIRFIPESYAEKTIDTIFINGYEVHVKMYSDMDSHITVESVNETVNYRDFNLDIEVIRDNETILSLTINKEHEIVYEHLSRLNLDEYYLRDFWVAKNNKYYKDVPCIYFEYYSLKSKNSSILEITPIKDGRVHFGVTELIN